MKSRVLVGVTLGLGLAWLSPVYASVQPATAVDPIALGSLDAVVKYCVNVNPGDAARYSALKISIFGQQSAATLAALEATKQYKQAFTDARTALLSATRAWTRQSCLSLVSSAATG